MKTIHDKIASAVSSFEGEILSTSKIIDVVRERYAEVARGSILPNDHGEGNKHPCWCAGTEQRIFDKINHGKYLVREHVKYSAIPFGKRVNQLWKSTEECEWLSALDNYWSQVKKENEDIEKELDALTVSCYEDIPNWPDFILNKYIPWKYTNPLFRKKNTKLFQAMLYDQLGFVEKTIQKLFNTPKTNIKQCLKLIIKFRGIGVAGASGLLAILFPDHFGTVDQFVVKGLQEIDDLPEGDLLTSINPKSISEENAVLLIEIMKNKARHLNELFSTGFWTPRKIDMVLWGLRPKDGNSTSCEC